MYESSDLRKGLKIEYEGDPYIVVQFDFVKPGKGQALYKCRLRNMLTGTQFDRNFRSGEKFGEPNLEEKQMEYLYKEGDKFCFMNTANYEQEFVGEDAGRRGQELPARRTPSARCSSTRSGRSSMTIPTFMNLRIVKADPWVKGDTASGDSKPATLETGYVLQVPTFLEEGQLIKVDTRTGAYVERVKE
ncbi:MAG: elongation factor P [Desulfobacterales bacterium]|nr:elongation factor P [Desulfobacterales bacterium]